MDSPAWQNATTDAMWESALLSLADHALEQVERFSTVKNQFDAMPSETQNAEHGFASLSKDSTGTACSTPAACKLKELQANRCNYGREALQTAYQGVNVAAHVMGVAISLLCGCVYVQNAAKCALQTVPASCVFPYSVYSKTFSGSVELWEAVKAASKTCLIHGDA